MEWYEQLIGGLIAIAIFGGIGYLLIWWHGRREHNKFVEKAKAQYEAIKREMDTASNNLRETYERISKPIPERMEEQ